MSQYYYNNYLILSLGLIAALYPKQCALNVWGYCHSY